MGNEIKEHELTIIFNTNASQEDIEATEYLVGRNFIIQKSEDIGVKRLAYKINEQDMGRYKFYELVSRDNEKSSKNLSQSLNIKDCVLRYLLVTVDNRKIRNR